MLASARAAVEGRRVGLVYQRYSLGNVVGLALAREPGVPFVLEYNGSEIWIKRNWGKPLRHEALAERIELVNLRRADVVVVVSEPMKSELVARGVDASAILVNPNGVDTDVYSPEVDGTAVRARYGLEGRYVIGFIGTFGPWHGAEVLASAFGHLVQSRPDLAADLRLLMIGDGPTLPETRRRLAEAGVLDHVAFAGRTAQSDGPAHLAGCDLLVSPHVPNPDGSAFFGSPTKLFEYMAMGKPIVASDLDQIGEVLDHGQTAWLVEPSNPAALADGLACLIDDPAVSARLGAAARVRAVERHTWRAHTERIADAVRSISSR
jgi:glycosyltransferase involved in cell wall biosynthesis